MPDAAGLGKSRCGVRCGVVERRQTMPVLANVLLSAKADRLTITATDLEVEMVAAAAEADLTFRPLNSSESIDDPCAPGS